MATTADQKTRHLYEFGPFRVDPEKELLLRNDEAVSIAPKAFQVLLVLMRHNKQVVTKDDLLKTVWPDTFVEEANLSRNIFLLRKALGESPQDHQYIVTVPGRGYRFAEDVQLVPERELDIVAASHATVQMEVHETRPWVWMAVVAILLSALGIVSWRSFLRRPPVLTEKDTIVLADFVNSTGDPIFDGTLRQGLAIQLEQSPFLSIISEQRVQETLQMMGQKPGSNLTPDIARELCQRTGSTAVLDGSIAQIGTPYLLTIKAVNCANGESLASSEAQASDKSHVLGALGTLAADLRNKLGESLTTVQRFDTPLAEATTPSLEALKAYSSGFKVMNTAGTYAEDIPFFKKAVELDPNFAMAYAWLGVEYTSIGEPSVAASYTSKAYELRDRASEAEKYFISCVYNKEVTGDLPQAVQSCELWIQAYPRMDMPHNYLSGAIYPLLGEYEKGAEHSREAIHLNPEFPVPYALLMFNCISLNRLDEAEAAYDQARERKFHSGFYTLALYQIDFLKHDSAGLAQQVAASQGQTALEDELLSLEADTAAYTGRLAAAREFSRQAMESAERTEEKEPASQYSAMSSLREALFGNSGKARLLAALAAKHSSGLDAQYGAALALAYAGDYVDAQAMTADLGKRFPKATIVQSNYLPTLRAKLALSKGNASEALEILRVALPYELGRSTYSIYGWTSLYPAFVRGEAFLAKRQGSKAAAEFQKILDHNGVVLNEPIGALAHLELGRAYAIQGNTVKAKAAYDDFLTLWKNADHDVPILKQAKVEYAKLK